jgi:hypothetical protein
MVVWSPCYYQSAASQEVLSTNQNRRCKGASHESRVGTNPSPNPSASQVAQVPRSGAHCARIDLCLIGCPGSRRLHTWGGSPARRTQQRISAGHEHTARYLCKRERVLGRLDLVRRRLGGKSWLDVCRLPLLRLSELSRSDHPVRAAAGADRLDIQHRGLLGSLLCRATLVRSSQRLVSSSTTATAPPRSTTAASETSAASTVSAAAATLATSAA